VIEALAELGKYALKQRESSEDTRLTTLIRDPASSPRYKHVFFIAFDAENAYRYTGIEYEQYSKDKIGKYLYRPRSSNRPDTTPTARVAGSLEGTFDRKIVKWFSWARSERFAQEDEDAHSFLTSLSDEIVSQHDRILAELIHKVSTNVKEGENAIVSLLIDNSPLGMYVGDFDIFKRFILREGVLEYHQKYGTESVGYEQVCAACNTTCPEVYGFVSTFTFYNLDKPGFVAGGFDRSAAWKNYPVCEGCALILEEGKKFLERDFNFPMYSVRYLLVPKALFARDSDAVIDRFMYYKHELPSLGEKYKQIIKGRERDILGFLAEQENFFNNNLLFYTREQSAFRILLYVEDVLPSHFAKMFEAKAAVDARCRITDGGEDNANLPFDFGAIYRFFPSLHLRKYFLEIINSIFTGKKIEYSFLIAWIMKRIRDDDAKRDAKGEPTYYSTIRGVQLLLFLHQMHLIKGYGRSDGLRDGTTIDNDTNEVADAINKLFEEFPEFFDTDAKRAIFLEGALTKLLLNVQWVERDQATPFRSKLNGLKLDERRLKKLLPEIQNKFQEYGKDYYYKQEELLAQYLLKAGSNWKMTTDEISFYFVIGMNLASSVKVKREDSTDTAGGDDGGLRNEAI
jgi:CRISPR-associated protein Csh1